MNDHRDWDVVAIIINRGAYYRPDAWEMEQLSRHLTLYNILYVRLYYSIIKSFDYQMNENI